MRIEGAAMSTETKKMHEWIDADLAGDAEIGAAMAGDTAAHSRALDAYRD
jgi:hypothetical protein